MDEPNLQLLSDADLLAIEQDRMQDLSDTALKYLSGEEIGSWESFTSNASRAVQSSLQTVAGWMGATDDPRTKQILQQKESEARIAAETNPVAGFVGQLAGGIADPVTLPALVLKPLTIAGSALKTGALRGAAAGTFGGALNPVFDEFGDSRMANIATGATLGGALGGAAAGLLKKFGIDISNPDPQSPEFAQELKEKMLALPYDKKEQLLLEWNGARAGLPAPEQAKLIGWDGKAQQDDPSFEIPTQRTEWDNNLKSLVTVEDQAPEVNLTLPPQIKRPIKINKVETQFANDVDHAFWVAGENKGTASQAAQSWLMEKTGMGLREVQSLARQVRGELARRVGTTTPVDGKLKIQTPSVWSATLIPKIAPTRVIRKPIQPKRIDVKDGLDPSDLEKLKLTGVNVSENNGQIRFRDAFNGNKFMGAATLKERMNAVGIDLDVPGYREKIKGAASVPEEVVAKVAEDAPVVKQAEAAQQASDVTGRGEIIRVPKPKDVLDVPPEDIGLPKQQRSVGSAGVDPKAYLTDDLMPKTAKDVAKGGEARERVLMNMLENDDPRVAIPKDMEKVVKGKGSFAALKQAGAAELKKIIKEYGNMAQFMIDKKGKAENMTSSQVTAFRWFYADAMANRARLLDKAADIHASGQSFDTPEGAELARDLVYYSGIDLFWKNDGTKASRAFNARRIISQTIKDGQTPQTKLMRGIFPGMSCQ